MLCDWTITCITVQQELITDHLNGPDRADSPVCVCVSVSEQELVNKTAFDQQADQDVFN